MASAGLSRDQIRVQAWADLLKVFKGAWPTPVAGFSVPWRRIRIRKHGPPTPTPLLLYYGYYSTNIDRLKLADHPRQPPPFVNHLSPPLLAALLGKEPGGPNRRTVALIVEPAVTPSADHDDEATTAAVPTGGGPAVLPSPFQLAQRIAGDLIAIGLTCSIHVGGAAAAKLVVPPRRPSNTPQASGPPADPTPVHLATADVVVVLGSRKLKRTYEECTDDGQLRAALDLVVAQAAGSNDPSVSGGQKEPVPPPPISS